MRFFKRFCFILALFSELSLFKGFRRFADFLQPFCFYNIFIFMMYSFDELIPLSIILVAAINKILNTIIVWLSLLIGILLRSTILLKTFHNSITHWFNGLNYFFYIYICYIGKNIFFSWPLEKRKKMYSIQYWQQLILIYY